MKISDLITDLQLYKNKFGNLDVYIPTISETETATRYTKKTILNDCHASVCDKENGNLVVLMHTMK